MKRSAQFPDAWKTLDRIRSALSLPQSELADILRLPLKQYQKMKAAERPLSLLSATSLIENLNLTWEAFVYDRIDYRSLIEYKAGNFNYIPEKFLVGAFSKRRTVKGFLDHIERFRGPRFKNNVLRHFQITETALGTGGEPINILFMQELLKFLREKHYLESDFVELGSFSAVANQGSSLHQSLLMTQSIDETYEHLIVDLVRYYEHNCDYRMVKFTDTGCVVESTPNHALVDAHKNWRIGSQEICLVRAGILASVPSYVNQLNSKVIETHCIHRGDHACRFEIEYNTTKPHVSAGFEVLQ